MLTIIARARVEPGRLREVTDAMVGLVAATLEAPGCLRYELHQDRADPTRLVFVEGWESRELWQAHLAGEAVRAFDERVAGAIGEIERQEMERVA